MVAQHIDDAAERAQFTCRTPQEGLTSFFLEPASVLEEQGFLVDAAAQANVEAEHAEPLRLAVRE